MKFRDFQKIEIVLAILVALTGAIHIYVGITTEFHQLTLAGLGFFGGLAIFVKGFRVKETVLLSLPFTGYQIFAYYEFYGLTGSPIAVVDKLAQVFILIIGTIYLYEEDHLGDLTEQF